MLLSTTAIERFSDMLLAPSKLSSSPLLQDVPRTDKVVMASPLSGSMAGAGTPAVAERAGRRFSSGGAFDSCRNSDCSLDDDNVELDDLTSVFLHGDSECNGVSLSGSTTVLGSNHYDSGGRATSYHTSSDGAQSPTPKRKRPHFFKQLANEFRWMHNNFKHGYQSGTTPKHQQQDSFGFLPTPQTTRENFDDDEELLTMGVCSSLRRSSCSPNAPTSASETGKNVHGGSQKKKKMMRWRTMENGEVEAVPEPPMPQTKPDPYAPPECRYVVRHPMASSANGCYPAMESEKEEVVLPDACLTESLTSYSDTDDNDHYRGDTSLPERAGGVNGESSGHYSSRASSDVGAVATRGTCRSDHRLAKVRRASDGILEDMDEDVAHHTRLFATCDDNYDAFLRDVAQLQWQVHAMEYNISELRKLYSREQSAQLHSKGKGQHLSWTRTVQAANTIHFWRMKVNLLRSFESQYVSTVQHLQQNLHLVDPEKESNAAVTKSGKTDGAPSPVTMQSRYGFLRSSRVITAQQQHLRNLGEQLKSCWQASANLREEIQRFELREARSPYDTFAVAGMDAEHFIASLPPRISAYGPATTSARSSVLSLDSMDDAQAPLLLLTAQNLSPTSEDDDNPFFPASPTPTHDEAGGGKRRGSSNLARATGDAAPLASCMKNTSSSTIGAHSTPSPSPPSETALTPPTSSPSSPKRLKYVIQSAAFDAQDGAATAADAFNNNSVNGRQSNRGGFTSRGMTPLTGALAASAEVQQQLQRRKRERHITFALEPEVLDTRPRFSTHSRTIQLLEQICMDKQAPWNGLTLLQAALEEREGELAAVLDRVEDEQREVLARAVTMTPTCASAPVLRYESERREPHSRPETAPSPTLKPVPASLPFEKTQNRRKPRKVKPKDCAQCRVM